MKTTTTLSSSQAFVLSLSCANLAVHACRMMLERIHSTYSEVGMQGALSQHTITCLEARLRAAADVLSSAKKFPY